MPIGGSTNFRVTLIFVVDTQNITLSLPRALLKRIKRLAADRETSVSALMIEALADLAEAERRYAAAKKRAVAAMASARSLGTRTTESHFMQTTWMESLMRPRFAGLSVLDTPGK